MNLNFEELSRIGQFLLSPNSSNHEAKAQVIADLVLGFKEAKEDSSKNIASLFFTLIDSNDLSTLEILSHHQEVKKVFNHYLSWDKVLSDNQDFHDLLFRKMSFILSCDNPQIFLDKAPKEHNMDYIYQALKEGYCFTNQDWLQFSDTFNDGISYQNIEHIGLLLSAFYSNPQVDLSEFLKQTYFSFPCLMEDFKKEKFNYYAKQNVFINGVAKKMTPSMVSEFTEYLVAQNYQIHLSQKSIDCFCDYIDMHNQQQFTSSFSKNEMNKFFHIIENKNDFIQALKPYHLDKLCVEMEQYYLEALTKKMIIKRK